MVNGGPHSKNSKCWTTNDGGETWQTFKPKPRPKKTTIEYDSATQKHYVQIRK